MNKSNIDKNEDPLRKRVYDYLRNKMETRSLLPGGAINLNEVSKELSISKTPLRDAMIRLEAEGFVTILPRRGIIVNRLDLEDIKYLFEIIGALESTMVRSNFDKFDDTILTKMDNLDIRMRSALAKDDFIEYSKFHWAFHDIFLDLSKNVFVRRILTPIKQRLWEFPQLGFVKKWYLMACDEHKAITQNIRDGNLEEAIRTIRELHWGYAYNQKFIRRVYFRESVKSENS